MFGIGPVPAVRQALERAGWAIGDVERVEINEAFAAIALAVHARARAAGGDRQRRGRRHRPRPRHRRDRRGADHAARCTRCSATASKRGVVTLCIGGGQGIALCVEDCADLNDHTGAGHGLPNFDRATHAAARSPDPLPVLHRQGRRRQDLDRLRRRGHAGRCRPQGAAGQHRPGVEPRRDARRSSWPTRPRPVPGVPGLSGAEHRPRDRGRGLSRSGCWRRCARRSSDEELATVREQLSGACTTEIAAFDEFAGLLAGDDAGLRPRRLRHRAHRPHPAPAEPAQGLDRVPRRQRPGRLLPGAAFRAEDARGAVQGGAGRPGRSGADPDRPGDAAPTGRRSRRRRAPRASCRRWAAQPVSRGQRRVHASDRVRSAGAGASRRRGSGAGGDAARRWPRLPRDEVPLRAFDMVGPAGPARSCWPAAPPPPPAGRTGAPAPRPARARRHSSTSWPPPGTA